jgi:GT2 family glycosyltransferase/glycosyltransferase involved in cell wall biosynthesis
MRVFVVAQGFPPSGQGGAEVYAHDLCLALSRLADTTLHVFTREQDSGRPEYDTRVEIRGALTITWVNNTFRRTRTFAESYRNPTIRALAARAIDRFRPDVAHVHHLTCLSTEIVHELDERRIPIVHTLHDYWLLCHRGQLLDLQCRMCSGPASSGCDSCLGPVAPPIPRAAVPLLRAVERRLPRPVVHAGRWILSRLPAGGHEDGEGGEVRRRSAHMADVCGRIARFLAPSDAVRDRFVEAGVDPGRITAWPYGFDCSGVGSAAQGPNAATHGPVRAASSDRRPLRLGFLGSLMISKAPHILLEAHRLMPYGTTTVDLFGSIVPYHGDDSYASTLRPLIDQPGVVAHGSLAHAKVPAALAQLDAVAVTSIWPETSPLVIREAFLAGIPVLASDIGGVPEIVHHEKNGLLVRPGDVADLRRAIDRLVNDRTLLRNLKRGAAQTTVRTIEDDAVQTRALYATLVSDRRGGASDAGTPATLRPSRPREEATERRRSADRTESVGAAMTVRVGAVVLSYQTPDDTFLAVSSALASNVRPDPLIVVDNDPAQTGRARLSRFGSRVTYLPTGRNLGFSGGMNAGIREALAHDVDHILIVNSDVVMAPDCVTVLLDELSRHPSAIAGPLIRSRAFPDRVASAGIDFDGRTGRMRHRESSVDAPAAGGERDSVSGCLMLIPRPVFDRVGLFDERYFFSFEEIDFCRRARRVGVATRLVPGAVAYHEGGRSMSPRSPDRLYFAARNHLMLIDAEPAASPAARWRRRLFVTILNVAHAVRFGGGSVASRLAATARGVADYSRGRFGSGT